MRLLHVSAYFAPAYVYGGPPRSIHGLCKALRRHGLDVQVFTTDANGEASLPASVIQAGEFEGVPVQYFPRSWPASPIGSRALAAAIRRALATTDLVHIHGLWNRVVWTAAREARRAGVPYLVSPRGMLEREARAHHAWRKRLAWACVERTTLAGAALLHATSSREATTLQALLPGAAVACVPNGVDLPPRVTPATASLALPDGPVIAFIGRLHPIKRLDLLIAAFSRVRRHGQQAHLVLAGPDEAGLRPSLERLAGEWRHAIHWLGAIDEARKLAVLRRAAALVLCSDSESFGLSAAEAMAAGVPVVVTRTCPWSDVGTYGAGFWVEQNAEAIAEALVRLLGNPAAAREMGNRGRALIETKYAWDSVAAALSREYRRVARQPDACLVEAVS